MILNSTHLSHSQKSWTHPARHYENLPRYQHCRLLPERHVSERADLETRGQRIGPNDLLIAATTRAYGATLATHKTAEFQRVAGLRSKIGRSKKLPHTDRLHIDEFPNATL